MAIPGLKMLYPKNGYTLENHFNKTQLMNKKWKNGFILKMVIPWKIILINIDWWIIHKKKIRSPQTQYKQ